MKNQGRAMYQNAKAACSSTVRALGVLYRFALITSRVSLVLLATRCLPSTLQTLSNFQYQTLSALTLRLYALRLRLFPFLCTLTASCHPRHAVHLRLFFQALPLFPLKQTVSARLDASAGCYLYSE